MPTLALIGLAVDRLLAQQREGVLPLVGIWLAHLLVSFLRQRYDTRAFSRIHAQLAQAVVLAQRGRGESLSVVSARAELSREIVDFFEGDLPVIARDLIVIGGALAMLFFYDRRCGVRRRSSVNEDHRFTQPPRKELGQIARRCSAAESPQSLRARVAGDGC